MGNNNDHNLPIKRRQNKDLDVMVVMSSISSPSSPQPQPLEQDVTTATATSTLNPAIGRRNTSTKDDDDRPNNLKAREDEHSPAPDDDEDLERKFRLRNSERLLFFTDAVVAIAATLLILPLMEAAASFGQQEEEARLRRFLQGEEAGGGSENKDDVSEEGETVADYFRQNGGHMGAFVLSFLFVSKQFWRRHAFLFTYVEVVSAELMGIMLFWMLSVIVFPVTVSLLFVPGTSDDTISASLIYLGVIWLNNILILTSEVLIRRDPRTWTEEYGCPTEYSLSRSILAAGIGAITMVVGGLLPKNGWIAVLLYVLVGPITSLILKCRPQLLDKRSAMDVAHDYYLKADYIEVTRNYLCRMSKGDKYRLKNLLRVEMATVVEAQHSGKQEEEASSNCHKSNTGGGSSQPANEAQATYRSNQAETSRPSLSLSKEILASEAVLARISNRLIIFTDAAIAISMTLLILPLMEKASELENTTAAEYFQKNARLCGSFVLSFFIVASRWRKHDSMFAYIEEHVPAEYMLFTTPWLLSITFMPVATALLVINDNPNDRGKHAVYLGTLLFNLIISLAMSFIVHRENNKFPAIDILKSIIATILCAMGLIIAMLVPSTGAYMPLLLFLSHPVTLMLAKIWPTLQVWVLKIA